MVEAEKNDRPISDKGELNVLSIAWEFAVRFWPELWAHFRFFLISAVVFVVVIMAQYLSIKPSYTAIAVIGPPGPSPVNSFIGNTNANSVASRLLGGGGGGATNNVFQEYLQLLQSVRLAKVLIDKHHLLQTMHLGNWDKKNNRWRSSNTGFSVINELKHLLGRRIKDHPDVDDMVNILHGQLKVSVPGNSIGARLSPLQMASPYPTVSFVYDDPQKAEQILNLILLEADNIIREDMRRNVIARLTFLNAEAPKVTVSDQREALIAIESQQEQLLMMIEADQRFASTFIEPPYASLNRTSPGSPKLYVLAALGLCSSSRWL